MREQELYDKFFSDEEYELENAPTETYSYQSGWNNALKRASIIIRNEIRPQGEWLHNSDRPDNLICSVCNCGWDMWRYESKELKFCPNCGADMRGGRE